MNINLSKAECLIINRALRLYNNCTEVDDEREKVLVKRTIEKILTSVDKYYKYGDKDTGFEWHNLRIDQTDLPRIDKRVLFTIDSSIEYPHLEFEVRREFIYSGFYFEISRDKFFISDDLEEYPTQGKYPLNQVLAWKYIEPFEMN